MTLDGGRRAPEAHDLEHAATAAQLRCDVLAHLAAHLLVVGTDVGGELLRVGLAVEDDDGYALVVGAVDGRRQARGLVGSHDEQVDARLHEAVYLSYLPLVAVIGRGEAQLYAVVEIGAHAQFVVELVAPDVLRALRHADDIARPLLGACSQKHCHQGQA